MTHGERDLINKMTRITIGSSGKGEMQSGLSGQNRVSLESGYRPTFAPLEIDGSGWSKTLKYGDLLELAEKEETRMQSHRSLPLTVP